MFIELVYQLQRQKQQNCACGNLTDVGSSSLGAAKTGAEVNNNFALSNALLHSEGHTHLTVLFNKLV